MIMIVGGQCQGKLAFAGKIPAAEKKWDGQLRQHDRVIADGRTDSFDKAYEAGIIYHLEAYIRRLMEAEGDSAGFVDAILCQNKDAVIIADEIGYGIVPVDAFEREYREQDGRLCQRIAAASEEVYRVVCAIGTRIK